MAEHQTTRLEPAWRKVACQTCGLEHRDDCPNRYGTLRSEDCGCGEGCDKCDYFGVRFIRVPGHRRFVPVQMREVVNG